MRTEFLVMATFIWMICGQGIYERTVADTVIEKTYLEWGHAPLYPECTTWYSRSEDGRRDTVRSDCSLGVISVNEYDAENRLAAVYRAHFEGDPYMLRYTYEYDAEGRLIKKIDHYLQTAEEYDYSTLLHTNMGYISADSEPEFDAEGRLIRMNITHFSPPGNCFVRIAQDFDNQGDEADCYYVLKNWADVSDEEKSRTVASETTWSYFENGYVEYRMRAIGGQGNYNMYNKQKTEYRFREQERGYSEETLVYIMFNESDSRWVLKDHSETFYRRDDARPAVIPTSAGDVNAGIRKVYGVTGGIEIETANAQTEEITVRSVSGGLVRHVTVHASGYIPLPKGFFIVTAGREAYKVLVR